MRVVVVGLGIQGRKRIAVAGSDVVATVDPTIPAASSSSIEAVPLDQFDAALLCTPDQAKLELVTYLLKHRKHVLIEKPLLTPEAQTLHDLMAMAQRAGVACYTAYNHRFEPHLVRLREILTTERLGTIYLVRGFYGNGTALNVKQSPWRDQGLGVLPDLGSHLVDLVLFLFGHIPGRFELWSADCCENRAPDHVLFGVSGRPSIVLEGTLVSWRNTFTFDVYGERGSAHVHGLCKWGPSDLIVRRRVFPSGKPEETIQRVEAQDPTWALEYQYFKQLCRQGGTNLENDLWISGVLNDLARPVAEAMSV